jgi:hypothetical protein
MAQFAGVSAQPADVIVGLMCVLLALSATVSGIQLISLNSTSRVC